jgi:hypothetical protein
MGRDGSLDCSFSRVTPYQQHHQGGRQQDAEEHSDEPTAPRTGVAVAARLDGESGRPWINHDLCRLWAGCSPGEVLFRPRGKHPLRSLRFLSQDVTAALAAQLEGPASQHSPDLFGH